MALTTKPSPDQAPPGCAWVLAKVITKPGEWRPYLRTEPRHGLFTSRQKALGRADAIKGDDQMLAILIELPPAVMVELAIETGSAS